MLDRLTVRANFPFRLIFCVTFRRLGYEVLTVPAPFSGSLLLYMLNDFETTKTESLSGEYFDDLAEVKFPLKFLVLNLIFSKVLEFEKSVQMSRQIRRSDEFSRNN